MIQLVLSGLLILMGVIITSFGIWIWAVSCDPLGYVPPMVPVIPAVGLALLAAGVLWRLA